MFNLDLLLEQIKDYQNVCFLNSNSNYYLSKPLPTAYLTLDWVLGFSRNDANHYTSFDSLEIALQQKKWLMGYLGYDLKNSIETLSSSNTERIGMHDLFFFEPEVLLMSKNGTIEVIIDKIGFEFNKKSELLVAKNTQKCTVHQDISKAQYLQTVNAIRNDIREGTIYEMNLCINFTIQEWYGDPLPTYKALNKASPTPFSAFIKIGALHILCASPERFMAKKMGKLISQPIKGTNKKLCPHNDVALMALRNNEKEQAENVMIVDLVRNDMAKSSKPGTVETTELFGVYAFEHLNHMISTVQSTVKDGISNVDIIKNAFPMGSMTGAPKVMAMQKIEEYERSKRGAYSGALGYFNANDDFDFNVIIRSIICDTQTKTLSFSVGSAITYDSTPELEYNECLLKAKAIAQTLQIDLDHLI